MHITADLIRRVEQSVVDDAVPFAEAFRNMEPDGPAVAELVGGGAVVVLGPGMYVNRASGMGLAGEVGPDDIDRVEALCGAAGVPAEFEVCPLAHESLLDLLGRRGYRLQSFRTVLLRDLRDLSDLSGDSGADAPGGIAISDVDEVSLGQWQDIAAVGFGVSDSAGKAISDRFTAARFRVPGERLFLAHLDGEPAANAALSISDGVATLGGMASAPAFRRRGLQAALITHRLRVAESAGCDLVVVAADPGSASERNLQRSGFSIAYTEVFLRAMLTE